MTENQRAWAIEEIENNILPDACDEVAEHALGYALEALKEPPRPKGRWKQCYDYQENYSNWYCSECGCEPYYESNIEEEYKFCPNCGAEMVRGEEE